MSRSDFFWTSPPIIVFSLDIWNTSVQTLGSFQLLHKWGWNVHLNRWEWRLYLLPRGNWGGQNHTKYAYVIIERSLIDQWSVSKKMPSINFSVPDLNTVRNFVCKLLISQHILCKRNIYNIRYGKTIIT